MIACRHDAADKQYAAIPLQMHQLRSEVQFRFYDYRFRRRGSSCCRERNRRFHRRRSVAARSTSRSSAPVRWSAALPDSAGGALTIALLRMRRLTSSVTQRAADDEASCDQHQVLYDELAGHGQEERVTVLKGQSRMHDEDEERPGHLRPEEKERKPERHGD